MSSQFLRRTLGAKALLSRISLIWLGMIGAQLILGIFTVLKNKPADIATAHVVLGAASLVIGSILTILAQKISVEPQNRMLHVSPHSSVKPVSNFKAALTTGK